MSLTITIPGAVDVTTGSMAPAVLTIGVGVPGAQGPQGPAGQGVPAGGTAGQFLQKIDGVSYNTDWVTVPLSSYVVKANNLSDLTSASTARTNLGLGTMATATAADYSTTAVANGLYYPLAGNPSGFLTSASLSGYATQSYVSTNFAPIAAGVPTGGTVGQILTKNSGTNYDASWATLIPGDRYVTTSSTSNSISNGAKTFTVGTGLSYSSQQDVVISYDASNHMHAVVTSYDSGTGVLVVDVRSHTGSGTYTSWTVNVGGTTPLQTVEWGEILGTLGDQSDLASALNAKLETSTAASTYAPLAGATFTGEVVTPASTTSSAGLMITPGVAPSSPVDGEIWATTNDLQVRLNGVTETVAEQSWVTGQGYLTSATAASTYAALSGATFTGLIVTPAVTTASAFLRLPHGTAPTTPVNGDVWSTTSGLFARINGSNRQYVDLDGTQTINGSKTFSNANQTLGNSTATGTINVATGATLSGSTKTVNIGTAGVAGSTTNITIGSTTGTVTTTLNGTVNATTATAGTSTTQIATTAFVTTADNLKANIASPTFTGVPLSTTAAADTNTTQIATTAFVVGQAGSATPIVDGTAAVGTSLRYARQDHVHPTDTTRAALASPTFTGTPAAPTAAQNTNTTQIATTAFVLGQASSTTPVVDGTAAIGTATTFARADHVHPTDTSRAPLASPALTGTPTAPTATAGTNTTQIATTAFVTAAVPAFATLLESVPGTLLDNKIVSPLTMMFNRMHGGFIDVPRPNMNYSTAGTGASVFMNGWLGSYFSLGSTVATGSVVGKIFGTSQADQQMQVLRKDTLALNQGYNFSKLIWLAGRAIIDCTDANVVARITLGKANAAGLGNLASKGIGIRKQGPTGAIQLMVHDGTTLTTVSSSITANGVYDIDVVSLGNGTVNLYIDKVLQATTSAGPVGNTTATSVTYQEEIESVAVPTVNFSGLGCSRMKIYSSW